jgi:hypothetical protein
MLKTHVILLMKLFLNELDVPKLQKKYKLNI